MPNKRWHELNPIDIDLRLSSETGMEEGVKQIIIRQCGFELYNTRPYHNYETWSDGWVVFGRKDKRAEKFEEIVKAYLEYPKNKDIYIKVSREDLDEAISDFINQIYNKEELKKMRTKVLVGSQRRKR